MSIRRAPRPESGFYILDKKISEDKRLSWPARGLLVYLLGKPDHWQVSVAALVNETAGSAKPTGRDGVYSLIRELEACGYLTKKQGRKSGGKFDQNDYIVSETPAPVPSAPLTAEPFTANPTQVSTESKQVLIVSKTECADGAPVAPEDLPVGLDRELWEGYLNHYPELQAMKGNPEPHQNWEGVATRKLNKLASEGNDPNLVVEQAINSKDGLLLPLPRAFRNQKSVFTSMGAATTTPAPATSGHTNGHTGHPEG